MEQTEVPDEVEQYATPIQPAVIEPVNPVSTASSSFEHSGESRVARRVESCVQRFDPYGQPYEQRWYPTQFYNRYGRWIERNERPLEMAERDPGSYRESNLYGDDQWDPRNVRRSSNPRAPGGAPSIYYPRPGH